MFEELIGNSCKPTGPIMLRRNHYRPMHCRQYTRPKIPPQAKCRIHRRKICGSITYQDYLVKFSRCYTQYCTRNWCAIFDYATTYKMFMSKKHYL